MFRGSLPTTAQQIICQMVKDWQVEDVYVGCSGNFTIERVLKNCIPARLHSNDVTVYSCLLGRYFTGQPLNVKLRADYNGVMKFVEKYMDDDAGTIAVMLILSKMAFCLTCKTNAYYERMIAAYKAQFENLWAATKEKISQVTPFISSMYEGDVCEWINKIPNDAGFICYPPFFAGDYEKMFRAIEEIFDWQPPKFENINKDRIHDLFCKLVNRNYFMFGTNDKLDEFKEYLAGVSQTTNRAVPIYIYAKSKKSIIVTPRQKVKSPAIQRLGANEDIGGELNLIKLKSEEFQALRSQYMNYHIKPGAEMLSVGVTADGKLIGVYAFSADCSLAKMYTYIDMPNAYLLSDFPVAPSKYKRLAKLVLYAALSKESKEIAESAMNKRIFTLTTTAFSKKPVSMKYRGLFNLLTKTKLDGTAEGETDISKIYYGNGYKLNYGAKMGEWTLAEGLAMWLKKYGAELETK